MTKILRTYYLELEIVSKIEEMGKDSGLKLGMVVSKAVEYYHREVFKKGRK